MTRRLLISLLSLSLPSLCAEGKPPQTRALEKQLDHEKHLQREIAQVDEELAANMLAFDRPWDEFYRKFFACPPLPAPDSDEPFVVADAKTCRGIKLGTLDVELWAKARERACKLFDLVEKSV